MREIVASIVDATLDRLVADGDLPAWPDRPRGRATVDVPRSREHGDWASNAALVYSKTAKRRPQEVATLFRDKLVDPDKAVVALEIAGPGFLNFRLAPDVWWRALAAVETQGPSFGHSSAAEGKRVDIEFVSANPTGPMHVGHGRGAVTGDVIASLLAAAGYAVTREYYINDAGNQIDTLARSVHLRYRELFGETIQMPEDSYPGEYVTDIAAALRAEHGDRFRVAPEAEWLRLFGDFAVARVLEMIRGDLDTLRIRFDVWFSERKQLQESGALAAVLADFRARDLVYDKEGAVFFRSTKHGDDKDRPVIKSNGQPTYLAGDIAYAKDKFERGYDWCLNIWGADHHGAIPRLQAAVRELGYDPQRLKFALVQMVNLLKDGQPFKMSKRAGTVVSLREVVDEVGADATRFFFLLRKSDTQLDFDIGLAKAQSNDNPVYYVQYGHARLCAILRRATEQGVPAPRWGLEALRTLTLPEELELAKRILSLPELIAGAAEAFEPHRVVFFLQETVAAFHGYYTRYRNTEKVIGPDPLKTAGRLYLCDALRVAMANALALLGVTAPERMDRDDGKLTWDRFELESLRMRDGNRLKEKIELHLDRRQVTSLSVVALLLSASIFALGVMVGKNLSPMPRPSAPAEALLDRLDAQADGGMGSPSEPLTFQDELTKKLPPVAAPASPLQKATKQTAPVGPIPAAPGAAPPQPPSPATQAPTALAAAMIDAGGLKALALKELTEKDSGVEVAVASKLPVLKVPPPPKSFFTVQVKATQSSTEADKFAKKLRGQGYQSLVAEAQVDGKGKWYRVRVGKFDTRAQADHYLQDFKRETHFEAFVTAAGH